MRIYSSQGVSTIREVLTVAGEIPNPIFIFQVIQQTFIEKLPKSYYNNSTLFQPWTGN
jgi:hypothetical protein